MRKDVVAIFDVATDRVAATLVVPDEARKCVAFVQTAFIALPFQENLNPEHLLSNSTKALGEVAAQLVKPGAPKPRHLFCFLASPFYAPQTRISHLVKDKPFTVTRGTFRDLANQERKHFFQSVGDPGGTKGKIIDESVMQVRLNRYVTEKPERQVANEVEITSFLSWGERGIIEKLENAIKPVFHQETIQFHSSTLAVFHALRALFPETPVALVLQIGGEITELSLINRGVLIETVSYPLGFNFLLRELGTRLNLLPAAAISLLKLGQKEGMTATDQEKFTETTEEIRFKWLAIFTELLRALSEQHFLAAKVFLVGDERFLPLFSSWLKSKSFVDTGILKKNLTIEPLTTKLHGEFCQIKENEDFPDELLLIDALFCARISK